MKDVCCSDDVLSAYLDAELGDAELQRVSDHLTTCTDCTKRLAALRAVDALVAESDTIEPSDEFNRTFWSKVSEVEQRTESPLWRQWLHPGWRPALAAGLTAGIIIGAVLISGPKEAPTLEEVIMSENMELLTEYDLIRHLDILENWDALEAMKERS